MSTPKSTVQAVNENLSQSAGVVVPAVFAHRSRSSANSAAPAVSAQRSWSSAAPTSSVRSSCSAAASTVPTTSAQLSHFPVAPTSSASQSHSAIDSATLTGRAMWIMMAMMLASNFLASLNQSLMNIALDQVANDFHVSLSVANWMVLGFTVVAATVITMAAALLKRFGVRKVMMLGYAASLFGSLLGLFAVNFPMMLAARLVQALTVGLFFPVVTSVVLAISPADKKGTMLAINSGIIGVGLALAPMLAGLMLTYFGLRALFLIPAVLSVALLALGFFFLHDINPRENRTIDIVSVVLSFVGLGTVIYGLNEVSRNPLPSTLIMVAGAVVVTLFAWRQFRIKTPLLNLTPLKHPRFVCGEVLMMLGYMGSIFMSLLLPLYLEGTVGYSAFIAGCLLALPILCYAASCFVGGRIEDKHGIWPLVPAGFLLLLVAFIGVEFTSSAMLVVVMLVCAAVAYIGVGLVFPTLKAADLGALPKEIYAHGAAIHSTLVQIAGSIGSALFVGVMSADVDRLMAAGSAKAQAYAAGFAHTLFIDLGILVVAFVVSVIFSCIMRKE